MPDQFNRTTIESSNGRGARRFLDLVQSHTTSYEVVADNVTIEVFPNVFSPKYSGSGDFLIRHLDVRPGARVIDMGCGTGLLGIAALRRGAANCLFVDINPDAVENAKANAKRLGFESRSSAVVSDGFQSVAGNFDLMLFNAPYWDRKPESLLEYACYDQNHDFLRSVLLNASEFLERGAVLYMSGSDRSPSSTIFDALYDGHWRVQQQHFEGAIFENELNHVRVLWRALLL